MNQATVLKILRILEKEEKAMLMLARPMKDRGLFAQADGIRFAIKTIRREMKSE